MWIPRLIDDPLRVKFTFSGVPELIEMSFRETNIGQSRRLCSHPTPCLPRTARSHSQPRCPPNKHVPLKPSCHTLVGARGHKGIANLIWGTLLKLDMGTASTALNEWRNPYAFERDRPKFNSNLPVCSALWPWLVVACVFCTECLL